MYINSKSLSVVALGVLIYGCAPSSNSPNINKTVALNEADIQRELAIKEQFALSQRLSDISGPIMLSNVELCGKLITNYIGAQFLTIDTVPKDFKAKTKSLYGVSEYPTVAVISANSPASEALQVGDVVLKVNGKQIPKGIRGIALVEKSLKDQKTLNSSIRVKRSGVDYDLVLQSKKACSSPVSLLQSDAVNAIANGKSIGVTRGMMRFLTSDTELATVIGHELAHNSRRHIQAKQTNAVLGAVVGVAVSVAIGVDVTRIGTAAGAAAHSHGFETEADYVGLYHVARSGYDISGAANLWRRMAASNPGSIGFKKGTHPSSASRFLTLEATIEEINTKKASNLPLIPEEKKAKALSAQRDAK